MSSPVSRLLIVLAAVVPTAMGCDDDEATRPEARELTRDATGHYCNMIVADHHGPKGQVFLESRDEPLWFSSVRDAIAFTMLPDEPKNITAIYVNDMSRANWNVPEPGTWIDARAAWYVIDSTRLGGMGAPEAAPFSDEASAKAFAAAFGGRVMAFKDVPADFILGGVDTPGEMDTHDMPDDASHELEHTE